MFPFHLSVIVFLRSGYKAYSTASMILFLIAAAEEQVCHGLDVSIVTLHWGHPLAYLAHFVDLINSLFHLLFH